MGVALMGTGMARGEDRAVEAARAAISSPLLEDLSIDGAHGVLINITGGPDLTLYEVNEASTLIQEAAHQEANIIFGAVIDEKADSEVRRWTGGQADLKLLFPVGVFLWALFLFISGGQWMQPSYYSLMIAAFSVFMLLNLT